jgi:hypothetical protein
VILLKAVDDVSRNTIEIETEPSKIGYPTSRVMNSELTAFKPELAAEDATTTASDLCPAWNRIETGFSLFWGDTTSPRFIERLPEDAFVLAVPFSQWHYDWLMNQSRSCIILSLTLEKELLARLLSALSLGNKALIFPWLPNWKMVELALNLNIKVYAGDPELDQCEQTISKLGFNLGRIDRQRW